MGTGAAFANLEFDSGFIYCLPPLACVVGVALETQHRDNLLTNFGSNTDMLKAQHVLAFAFKKNPPSHTLVAKLP